MSKNTYRRMKQRLHEQQQEIERLKHNNREQCLLLNETRLCALQQFSDALTCVFEQCMMDVITEEQAGKLMIALTGAMRYDMA